MSYRTFTGPIIDLKTDDEISSKSGANVQEVTDIQAAPEGQPREGDLRRRLEALAEELSE
jgi:hypothetical protein